jgi:hypothetical protein
MGRSKHLSPRMIAVLKKLAEFPGTIQWYGPSAQAFYASKPVTATVLTLRKRGLAQVVLNAATPNANGHVEITAAGLDYLKGSK